MPLPNFTAEAACHATGGRYRAALSTRGRGFPEVVAPAAGGTTLVTIGDNIYHCWDCGSMADGTTMQCCDPTPIATASGGVSGFSRSTASL
jgi:hypothetical protein